MSKIVDSINYLKEEKWIDLTHTVSSEIPKFGDLPSISEETLYTWEDGFFLKTFCLPTSYGTHLDAPVHFVEGKRYLEDIDLKEFVLPLYVIHKEDEVAANPDYRLTKEDIIAYEKEHGDIPAGSLVAFSSGWSKRWEDKEAYYNIDTEGQAHTPGWAIDALEYLNEERKVAAIGHETLDTDSSLDVVKNGRLICEYYWLDQDKFQVEVLNNLPELPATGGAIFIAVPKIKGAPGFNARIFAIVPNE